MIVSDRVIAAVCPYIKWFSPAALPDAWELYDLVEDRTELRNRAADEPARVVAMMAMYDAWAARCGVRPWPLKRGQ